MVFFVLLLSFIWFLDLGRAQLLLLAANAPCPVPSLSPTMAVAKATSSPTSVFRSLTSPFLNKLVSLVACIAFHLVFFTFSPPFVVLFPDLEIKLHNTQKISAPSSPNMAMSRPCHPISGVGKCSPAKSLVTMSAPLPPPLARPVEEAYNSIGA